MAAILEEGNILLFYANPFFCFIMQVWLVVTWANTLYIMRFRGKKEEDITEAIVYAFRADIPFDLSSWISGWLAHVHY